MRLPRLAICCLLAVLVASGPALAWGPGGHHAVGAIADRLLAGTPAQKQVKAILGGLSLQDASVWADCAKGVDPGKNYRYQSEGRFPECGVFEDPAGEAAMSDYVRRNDKNCDPKPGEESCHKQYHYADIAIQHVIYNRNFVGGRTDDVVHAIQAAIRVLKGEPAPAPFSLKDKREALLLLAHLVGDIHQPLHVGAVYLDAGGRLVNPDLVHFDARTETRGGNDIVVKGERENLHALWDAAPAGIAASHLAPGLLRSAKAVPATGGWIEEWPATWATESLAVARQAYLPLRFGPLREGRWSATAAAGYRGKLDAVKAGQIAKAGARLAQLLRAIWP